VKRRDLGVPADEKIGPTCIQAHRPFLAVFGNPATQAWYWWLSFLRSSGVCLYRFKKLIKKNLQCFLKPVDGYFRKFNFRRRRYLTWKRVCGGRHN